MILVTGSTGNIGAELVRLLVARGLPVRALVRAPAEVGCETVVADIDRPATLAAAFAGIERAFLLAPGPNIPAQDAALIAAAERAGVTHVVLLSSAGVTSGTGSGPAHAPGEARLRASTVGWTILRPTELVSNVLMSRDTIITQSAFYAPCGEGRSAMIDPRDIAAAAAHVLTTEGHTGATYELTGPEAITRGELAEKLSRVLGRRIAYVDIPDAAFRAELAKLGLPPAMIEPVAAFYALVKAGGAAQLAPALPLGARHTVDDWLAQNADRLR